MRYQIWTHDYWVKDAKSVSDEDFFLSVSWLGSLGFGSVYFKQQELKEELSKG